MGKTALMDWWANGSRTKSSLPYVIAIGRSHERVDQEMDAEAARIFEAQRNVFQAQRGLAHMVDPRNLEQVLGQTPDHLSERGPVQTDASPVVVNLRRSAHPNFWADPSASHPGNRRMRQRPEDLDI
jgi:hypothetical protein